MSGTLNKVMLIGHLGDDVKMHYFEGGNSVGRFSLATNETYTSKQTGERITNTDWHTVVVRNKIAELCEKYLSKGDKVYVEGRLKNRQWQGEDGNARYSAEVHVQDFTFLTTKKESEQASQSQRTTENFQDVDTTASRNTKQQQQSNANADSQKSDLPF